MDDVFANDPFIPIIVSKQGEAIRPNQFTQSSWVDGEFLREELHLVCEGIVKISRVSETHKVLYCGKCGLRRFFPATVRTYAGLRAHFAKVLKIRRRKNKRQTKTRRRTR